MSIQKVVEVKNGSKWEVTHTVSDVADVYKSLANDLVNKKLNKCTYIKSIKRTPLYNGFDEICVVYDNEVRAIYTVEN